jgi:hypothetical protein
MERGARSGYGCRPERRAMSKPTREGFVSVKTAAAMRLAQSIVESAPQTERRFAYARTELLGQSVERLEPAWWRRASPSPPARLLRRADLPPYGRRARDVPRPEGRNGVPGKDQPLTDRQREGRPREQVDPGRDRTEALRAGTPANQRRVGEGSPDQQPFPGQPVTRAAHAVERDHAHRRIRPGSLGPPKPPPSFAGRRP